MSEVKVNKISPSSGTAFTLGDSGDTFTVPSGATIVNSGTATGFGGGTTIKRHYFDFSTRTAGVTGVSDQFTITSSFTPTDPTSGNNDLFVEWIAPANGANQGWVNVGLEFNDGTTDYDYEGGNNSIASQSNLTARAGNFNISAGTIPAGTYTIIVKCYSSSSQPDYWNPNSSDDARVSAQTKTTLMITEYKN